MTKKLNNCRLLIYSHDSFGLGHLRRCRTIAHALVDAYKGLSVLILTGSPIIGQFDFKARVDFVRIPGVIKLHNGSYTSLALHIDLEDTLALRESIIHHTARVFAPDIFLVDKEPTGLQGEVLSTLNMLKHTSTRTILGLRDVMDDPDLLEQEWERKEVWTVLESLYDELWVYGTKNMGHPLEGLPQLKTLLQKTFFTGYLERHVPENTTSITFELPKRPYLLVTPGGGGDGYDMVDWVMRAYEASAADSSDSAEQLPLHALFVFGPFMDTQQRQELTRRAKCLEQVSVLTFSPNLEYLIANARAVVAMGGYNTFCEILSFDKPALIIPRSKPRREQLIRASKAEALGLLSMLDPEKDNRTETMIRALHVLMQQTKPSEVTKQPYLVGLGRIAKRFAETTASDAPKILLYVQYLLGIGHVRRSALIAQALVQQGFDVHVVFGGVPVAIDFAPAVVHYLPPVKVPDDRFTGLYNPDDTPFSAEQKQQRCQQLLVLADNLQPDIILTETYPFGRRLMGFELLPLLEWSAQQRPRPLLLSSVRDILQQRKPERMQETLELLERYYDHVLVHGDERFVPLSASFPLADKIAAYLGYSGYVCPEKPIVQAKRAGFIVSVGSGTIGYELLLAAIRLYKSGFASDRTWTLMAGPNMPDEQYQHLLGLAGGNLKVMRMATDFVERLQQAELSVSRGGYNTTMDILQTGVPSVMVPFEGSNETEQLQRTRLLDEAGRVQMVLSDDLSVDTLRAAAEQALKQTPRSVQINTEGAEHSARLVWSWWQAAQQRKQGA